MLEKLSSVRWRHDLKNQLGIVLGFTELILQDIQKDHPLRADIEEVLKAARQAMILVDELEESEPSAP